MTDWNSSTDPEREEGLLVPMRINRYLARCGVDARRACEKLVSAGRVTLNGQVVTQLHTKVDPTCDQVCVDGKVVSLGTGCAYILLNKPAGYLSTMKDPFGRPTVASLIPTETYPGLFISGRLDLDTTGALLATTDGRLSNALLHPSSLVVKRYEALVEGHVEDGDLEPLRQGVLLEDGYAAPAQVRILDRQRRPVSTLVECCIHEGKTHQVKRMLQAIGHPVLRLHRASFGPLELGDLEEGSWRLLDNGEVQALKEAAEGVGE